MGFRSNHDLRTARVRAVVKTNVTLATGLNAGDTVDGLTVAADELYLLVGQTDPKNNGIYVAGTSPARHLSFRSWDSHVGLTVVAEEGTYKDQAVLCTADQGGTLGTTALNFILMGSDGVHAIATTGGNTTLTPFEASHAVLSITGVKGSNATITLPTSVPAGTQITVANATSGAFTLTVLVSGQTGIVVANSKTAILYSNGTDVARATADV